MKITLHELRKIIKKSLNEIIILSLIVTLYFIFKYLLNLTNPSLLLNKKINSYYNFFFFIIFMITVIMFG